MKEYQEIRKLINATPAKQFNNFKFSPGSKLISRIQTKPDHVLKFLKILDSRENYSIYKPSKKEIQIIKEYISLLPKLHKKILKEKLLGFYFINNFLGNGLTDWVVDKNDNIYTFIVFNSKVFENSFSQLLSLKENSCFVKDDSKIKIEIKSDLKKNGFFYILMHEATHAVDYVLNITPFVDNEYRYIRSIPISKSKTAKGIWKDFKKPVRKYEFPQRQKLSFYGMGKGPQIKYRDAIKTYKNLAKTPFASLYGSTSWSEDIVELLVFYHITQVLKKSYSINVYDKEILIYSFEPMSSTLVKTRFPFLKIFY